MEEQIRLHDELDAIETEALTSQYIIDEAQKTIDDANDIIARCKIVIANEGVKAKSLQKRINRVRTEFLLINLFK